MVLSARQTTIGLLLRVVDCCLAGAIFVVPLLMGGRHAVGQLALTAFAVAAAWAWCLGQCLRDDHGAWRPTAALPLLLLGALLLVVQAVPLPAELLSKLAPRTGDVLPLWTASEENTARLGYWNRVSYAPAETIASLVIFLDYALLFLVAVQRIGRIEDVERLLRWCAISVVIMAAVGVLQLLFGNGKFFWFYEHPLSLASGVAKGAFTNRNHFAQFMALGVGPLIWWLQDSMRRSHGTGAKRFRTPGAGISRGELTTYMLGLSLAIVLFAGLLSLSRGGIVAMFLAAVICTTICWRKAALGGRPLAALIVSAALIGAALGIFGYERVSGRLQSLTSGSLDRIDRSAVRRTVWAATIDAAADFLPLGTGAGSFQKIYPMYTGVFSDERLESPSENSYLQIILETGAVGTVLMLAALGLCVSWCIGSVWSSAPTRYVVSAAAIAGSLAALSAHALVDYVWHVPACMAMAVVLAACAQRVWWMSKGRDARGEDRKAVVPAAAKRLSPRAALPVPRPVWSIALLALTAVGGWMIFNRVGPAVAQTYWDEYFLARNVMRIRPMGSANPEIADERVQQRWIGCLEQVVRWSPTHVKARLALAEAHRRLFDAMQEKSANRMPLAHIRDAALQSNFQSQAALNDWLARAVGDHWTHLQYSLGQALKALSLCPLEGRAYLYLAELSFLRGGDETVKRVCIQQALRVRPHDGDVLYAAAEEAILAGNVPLWLEYAKKAAASGPRCQLRIITRLVSVTPAENIPTVADFAIREFDPDLVVLRALHDECLKRCPPRQLEPLARYRMLKVEREAQNSSGPGAAALWLEAHRLHNQMDNAADAIRCARQAMECDPNGFEARYRLALSLIKQHSYAEAETMLRWCRQLKPGDKNVEANLRKAMKGRLDGPRRTALEHKNTR
ncbi:MAG: O-antigen ligase family protein [Pirellulales bacterium]|nr:O-antigen ligase family protein [Pirellulales bacterium]